MKALLPILIAAFLAAPAVAGGRRRAAVSEPREEITIAFVGVTSGSGSDGLIDAGPMSGVRRRCHRCPSGGVDAALHTTLFGIRLDGLGKTATLRASLESFDGRCIVRVDGIELGTAAKIIAARTPLGSVTTHTLEIEVPASVPEGAFATSVRWEVTAE
jgi:hypothetical protein